MLVVLLTAFAKINALFPTDRAFLVVLTVKPVSFLIELIQLYMQKAVTHRQWIIMIHLLFWLLIACGLLLVFNFSLPQFSHAIGATIVNLIGLTILVYIHLLWLLPRLFDQKKYWKYALSLLILLLGTTALRFFVGWELVRQLTWNILDEFTPSYFGSMIFSGTFFLLITIPLRLIEDSFKKQQLEQALKTHQLEAELRFLKAQVIVKEQTLPIGASYRKRFFEQIHTL